MEKKGEMRKEKMKMMMKEKGRVKRKKIEGQIESLGVWSRIFIELV